MGFNGQTSHFKTSVAFKLAEQVEILLHSHQIFKIK